MAEGEEDDAVIEDTSELGEDDEDISSEAIERTTTTRIARQAGTGAGTPRLIPLEMRDWLFPGSCPSVKTSAAPSAERRIRAHSSAGESATMAFSGRSAVRSRLVQIRNPRPARNRAGFLVFSFDPSLCVDEGIFAGRLRLG